MLSEYCPLAPDFAERQAEHDLNPALVICPISRAKWRFLLLFVFAPFLLAASPFFSAASPFFSAASPWVGAKEAGVSQIHRAAAQGSLLEDGFSGKAPTRDPLNVEQGTSCASEATKFDCGKSNIGAALFTHPTHNLLSDFRTTTERSTRLLSGFHTIVSSSTARGPPSGV